MHQPDLFARAQEPEGFLYRPDMLAPGQAALLVAQFKALPLVPFEFHGYTGKRRVLSFGWRYDYTRREAQRSDPLPDFLRPLREAAADLAKTAEGAFEQALVTEYSQGAGIGWHRDKAVFGDVVAFSFGAPCTLRFRREGRAGWERASRRVEPRSAYLLRGPARSLWEHSIPAVPALRYSVTLRTMAR